MLVPESMIRFCENRIQISRAIRKYGTRIVGKRFSLKLALAQLSKKNVAKIGLQPLPRIGQGSGRPLNTPPYFQDALGYSAHLQMYLRANDDGALERRVTLYTAVHNAGEATNWKRTGIVVEKLHCLISALLFKSKR